MSKAKLLSYGLMFVLAPMVGCGDGDGGAGGGGGGGTVEPGTDGGGEPAAAAGDLQEPDPNGGTVAGKIAFEGTVPAPKSLRIMLQTEYCAKHHKGKAPLIETVIVNDNKTLMNVVVSITGLKGKWKGSSEPVVLDQVGCMYVPHVVAKHGGQALTVKNSDNQAHNIKADPKARGNGAFNISQARKGMTKDVTKLKRPENVFVSCNVHSWMGAWICVFDHPFFAVTGEDGTYKLPAGIPPGTYTVEAWHETLGKQTAEVEVKAGETTTADLTFKAE